MKTNFELLKEYLKNTPKDVLLREWEQTKKLDEIGIPAKSFLRFCETTFKIRNLQAPWTGRKFNQIQNPEFNFGFFSTNY